MDIQRKQSGFTLFELIVVVVVIGILMATSLKYYNDILDDARKASVQYFAGQFAAVVANVHLKWVIEDRPPIVAIEDGNLLMNEYGWPVGEQTLAEKGELNSCQQLWHALLQKASELPASLPEQKQGAQYWAADPKDGLCKYQMVSASNKEYFFEYRAYNGKVRAVVN